MAEFRKLTADSKGGHKAVLAVTDVASSLFTDVLHCFKMVYVTNLLMV